MSASSALVRRNLGDARTRTLSFALLFLFAAAAQSLAYANAYPTRADRLELARTFGTNKAVRLLYGTPHDLLTVGGYVSWRLGMVALFSAVFGVLAAVRALRAEEEAGRMELVLAAGVTRRAAFAAALAGIATTLLVLWVALVAGIASGGPSLSGSAYLALALVTPGAVFAGVGAVTSQLAPTRRGATMIGMAAVAVALLLRMVADVATSLDWVRWATPLGWAEELRAFTGARPLVLVLPAVATLVLLAVAECLGRRRDIGLGLFAARDSAAPRPRLLRSPATLAVRLQRGGFVAWLAGVAVFAVIFGVLADSVASALSGRLRQELERLGSTAANTPEGFLGFGFEYFVLAVCLFACFELVAVREEEATERLETTLAQPVDRVRWLAQRLAVIAAGCVAIALTAAVLTWLAAALQGADVHLGRLLEAGVNCLPVALLFLGLGTLAYAAVPRATALVAYGSVGITFVWQVVGELMDAPGWSLGLSPFHHVPLVPAAAFDVTAALALAAVGLALGAVALALFRRRDVVGA